MGKNKRARLTGHADKNKGPSKSSSISRPSSKPSISETAAGSRKKHVHQQHLEPTIPFEKDDRILLIGEGDLSFAVSLLQHHGCRNITPTVLEPDLEALEEKYPHASANVASLEGIGEEEPEEEPDDGEEENRSDSGQNYKEQDHPKAKSHLKVLYGVDATKLVWPGKSKSEKWSRIIFNFPHVGGKSTDVNRQVRYNQELLVSFFRAAAPLLTTGGSIITTIFEGTPYTLWNIKDLARHSNLTVERSFKFQSAAYPGYHHARTIGVIRKKDGSGDRAGWKGEERPSRSFVFVTKGESTGLETREVEIGKRKRSRTEYEDEDEDEG